MANPLDWSNSLGDPLQQILAIYELPVGLVVAPECLGTTGSIIVTGTAGEIFLPTADWSTARAIGARHPPDLVAPILPGLPPPGQRLLDDLTWDAEKDVPGSFWGGPFAGDSETEPPAVYVGQVALRFIASQDKSTFSVAQTLFDGVDAWFETLATWIRVVIDQDVDPTLFSGSSSWTPRGLQIQTVSAEATGSPIVPRRHITLRFPPNWQPLDVRLWQYALTRTNDGLKPPIEYIFATDARAAARLGQYRRAAFDAATSVELSLNRILDARLAILAEPIRSAVRNERRMLGSLVDLLDHMDSLPTGLTRSNIDTKVVKLRNRAIHSGYTPSRKEAVEAAHMATVIASAAVPLPGGGP